MLALAGYLVAFVLCVLLVVLQLVENLSQPRTPQGAGAATLINKRAAVPRFENRKLKTNRLSYGGV